MKNVIALTLVAVMAAAFTTPKAEAGDKEKALIGGIIGGLIIGEILDDDRRGHSSVHVSYGSRGHGHHRRGGGYYTYETYKCWVPGGYVWHYDDCGVRYRTYRRGYYTYEKRKIWVPHHSGGHHYRHSGDSGYDRHRDYGRGNDRYDRHDRYDDRRHRDRRY